MRFAFLPFFILLSFSCSPSINRSFFTVTTYNLYAFFDSYEDGDEYEGFAKSDGYDGEAYSERIRNTAILIGKVFSSSDVIILEEVESNAVLLDLLEAGLKEKGFIYYGLADDENNLSVGFLSKLKPLSTALHVFPGCRPILELVFQKSGELIHIFGVHFRSRIPGGDDERMQEALHLAALMERNPDALCIAAGDFNTDPLLSSSPFSLSPDCYDEDNAFHVTGDPSKTGPHLYFSPLNDPDAVLSEDGTYFYDGVWYFYDLFLLSEKAWDGEGWEYDGIIIESNRTMKDNGGRPFPYDVSTGYGYSDHFPVTLRLKRT